MQPCGIDGVIFDLDGGRFSVFFQVAGYDDYRFGHKGTLQHILPILADFMTTAANSGYCAMALG